MIKAILFDFDGVLTKDKDDKVQMLDIFKRETGLSEEQIMDTLSKHFISDMYYGKVSFIDCWNAICDELKVSRDLVKEYIEATPLDERILDLAKRLRKDYRVGMITTNSKERMDQVVKHFNLTETFHDIFVSADMGVTKWEKEMFEQAIKSLNVKPEEVFFIDNSPKNLVEPDKLGMKTFLYTYSEDSHKELIEEMKKQGISV